MGRLAYPWLLALALALTLAGCGAERTPPPAPTATPMPTQASLTVTGGKQSKSLTCESQTASDLAKFWGKNIGEMEFFNKLPRSDNPFRGFVGSPDAPPGSFPPVGYGVYAEPVAEVLRSLGLDAQAHQKRGINWLRAELAAGRPVMVWATYGFKEQPVKTYKTKDGQSVPIVQYEHSFLAVGYDAQGIWVIDPLDAARKQFSYAEFTRGWDLLGQMAVTARPMVAARSDASPASAPVFSTPPVWILLAALMMLALGLASLRLQARPRRRTQTAYQSNTAALKARVVPAASLPAIPHPSSFIPLLRPLAALPIARPLPLALLGVGLGLLLVFQVGALSPCFNLPVLALGAGAGLWAGVWADALRDGRLEPKETKRKASASSGD